MTEIDATTAPSTENRDVFMGQLVEEFTARLRAGENVSIGDYTARHPNLATELRQVLGAICVLEGGRPTSTATLTQLGDYRILRELGRGGMGVVYEAVQTSLDRRVALKVLPASQFPDANRRERFRREAHAAARLHHTNIVPVFAVGEQDDILYYAMQLIEGQGLDVVVKEWKRTLEPGRQRTQRAARLIVQAAEALEHAHRQGILHRDIKPSNLLLDANGTVWLSDFGLVHSEGDVSLTATGQVLGTLRYLPPEGFHGQADTRSDVYSLGLTLYELLAGRPAFDETDHLKLMKQASEAEPPALRSLCSGLPRDLETIVLKAIARDPSRRYSSAGEFAEDLRRFQNGDPVLARRLGVVRRCGRWVKRNRALAVALCLVGLVLVAAAGLVVRTLDSQELAAALNQAVDAQQSAETERGNAENARGETQRALERERHVVYANRIQLADNQRTQGRLGESFRTLQGCAADLRGWEWHYLYSQLRGKSLQFTTHRDYPPSQIRGCVVAISPDGQLLAYPTTDRSVAVCDAATGDEKVVLREEDHPIVLVGFHPGNQRVTTVTLDQKLSTSRVRVWELATAKPVSQLSLRYVRALSPDGQYVAHLTLGKSGDALAIKKTDTGQLVDTVPVPAYRSVLKLNEPRETAVVAKQAASLHARFSSDNNELLIFCNYTSSVIRAVLKRPPQSFAETALKYVAFMPQNRLFTSRGFNVEVRERDTLEVKWSVSLAPLGLHALASSPDGRRLALALSNNTIQVWDAETRARVSTYQGHAGTVFSVDFSPDGKRLLSTCRDGTVQVWHAEDQPPFRHYRAQLGKLPQLRFHPDGTRLAVTGTNSIQIWQRHTGTMLSRWDQTIYPGPLAFHPGGRLLASVERLGRLTYRDVDSGKEQSHTHFNLEAIARVDFSPNGELLFVQGPRQVLLWDTVQQRGVLEQKSVEKMWSAAVSGDFRILAFDSGTEVSVANAITGERLLGLPRSPTQVPRMMLSPDGGLLAVADEGASVVVWETATGKLRHRLQGHEAGVAALAFSPDGRRLATASLKGRRVLVWDLATGLEVLALPALSGMSALAFSPDGACLAGAGGSGLLLWDCQPGS